MENWTFQLFPCIHYGAGAASRAGEEIRKLGVTHALVVTDPGILAAGVGEAVWDSLREAGVAWTTFSGVATNPTDEQVMAAVAAYRASGTDGIVGMGGGSSMDVAKSAAAVVSNGGHIRDYEDGARPIVEAHPPLVFIPTTAGTGSEVVGGTIILDTSRQFKMHIVAVPGHAALCDPLLTLTLPPEVTAATGLDALSHAVGAYASADRQPLADAYAFYAIELVNKWLMRAVEDGQDLEARQWMMVAALTAGISMKGGGTADHAFAHGINALHQVHHGVGCAVFLADVMEFNLRHIPERYARIAQAMGVDGAGMSVEEHGQAGIDAIRALVRTAGIPSLRNLGVEDKDVPTLVDYVMRDEFHLGINPVPVTAADARQVLEKALLL